MNTLKDCKPWCCFYPVFYFSLILSVLSPWFPYFHILSSAFYWFFYFHIPSSVFMIHFLSIIWLLLCHFLILLIPQLSYLSSCFSWFLDPYDFSLSLIHASHPFICKVWFFCDSFCFPFHPLPLLNSLTFVGRIQWMPWRSCPPSSRTTPSGAAETSEGRLRSEVLESVRCVGMVCDAIHVFVIVHSFKDAFFTPDNENTKGINISKATQRAFTWRCRKSQYMKGLGTEKKNCLLFFCTLKLFSSSDH